MKKSMLVILIGLFTVQVLFSQDMIIPLNGDDIIAINIQIYRDSITYFDFDIPDGHQKVMSVLDIYMIKYENGTTISFSSNVRVLLPADAKQVSFKRQTPRFAGRFCLQNLPLQPGRIAGQQCPENGVDREVKSDVRCDTV